MEKRLGRETPAQGLPELKSIAEDLESIRRSAENLRRLGDRFPAVSKNAARILASLKMIELGVPDPSALLDDSL